MKLKEIVFWGTEPPPIGGMSVHIKRLSEFLNTSGWKVYQYNFNKKAYRNKPYVINVKNLWLWYFKLWILKSPKTHYVITTKALTRFLACLLVFRGKIIILRVGGRSLENGLKMGGFEKLYNVLALKLCSAFIGVNKEICTYASKHTSPGKVHHIPGFIPPLDKQLAPKHIREFFTSNSLNIVVTGQITNQKNEDIYGLFHTLDALAHLKEMEINFKCCVVSYTISGNNVNEIDAFQTMIKSAGLTDNVLLYHNTEELWPILKECDIFLRPSITDGDANSIREAIFLNKIVIASNCVGRPKECYLYQTLEALELASKIAHIGKIKINYSQSYESNNQSLILNLLNTLEQ